MMRFWIFLAVSLVAAMSLSSCGGGSAPGPEPTPSGLWVDRSTLDFAAEEGEADPAVQFVGGSLTGVTTPVSVEISYTNASILGARFEQTGPTSGQLRVQPRPWSELPVGTTQDVITVRACLEAGCARQAPGSPKQVRVSYTVTRTAAAAHLQLSRHAVAFASVPNGQRLSGVVRVSDSLGGAEAWTATSDAAWLQVTGSGTGSQTPLALTADPSRVADGMHLATVTVRSSNPAVAQTATVRVGLYKSGNAPAARLSQYVEPAQNVDYHYVHQVVDPVRPLIYAAYRSWFTVHHLYTGERLAFVDRSDMDAKGMTVSDDGSVVYVLDQKSKAIHTFDPVSLSFTGSFTPSATPAIRDDGIESNLAFNRVAGRPVLLMSDTDLPWTGSGGFVAVLDAANGRLLGREFGLTERDRNILSVGNGVVWSVNRRSSSACLPGRSEFVANARGTVYARTVVADRDISLMCLDWVTSSDGNRLITPMGTVVWNGSSLQNVPRWPASDPLERGIAFASEVEALGDGRFLRFDLKGGPGQISGPLVLYDAQGQWLNVWRDEVPAEWRFFRQDAIRTSSDGLRAVRRGVFFDLPKLGQGAGPTSLHSLPASHGRP